MVSQPEPLSDGGLNNAFIRCLHMEEPGTPLHSEEANLIAVLNNLCKQYGYGRIGQMASQLEDLWRHPERHDHYQSVGDELRELRRSDRAASGLS